MKKYTPLKRRETLIFFLLSGLFLLTSCEEKLSGIGYDLLRDTVSVQTTTLGDSGVIGSSAYDKKDVNALGIPFAANYGSPRMFIGKVPSENLESWIVLKAPLLPDTVGYVSEIKLHVPMGSAYLYGDPADDSVRFEVYMETQGKITDSTKTISLGELTPLPVGYANVRVAKDSVSKITIVLDSSRVNPFVHTTSLAFVLVPDAAAKSIRSFSSSENEDVLLRPSIQYTTIKNGDTTEKYYDPKFDFHLVTDNTPVSAGIFTIRGSVVKRNRFTLDITSIKQKLALDPFTTFNNGLLQLHLVPGSFSSSYLPVDEESPILLEITSQTTDSAVFLVSEGLIDESNSEIYNFQIRGVIERALRNGLDSVVLELRSGYAQRSFTGVSLLIEDYHLSKWSFYDVTASDPTKRPVLVLTYSYLNK